MKNKFFVAIVGTVGITLLLMNEGNTALAAPAPNRIAVLLNGKDTPRLSMAQAEAFAEKHQRRPEALLAAYQASQEKSFLREAMAKHPRDPRVALAAACLGTDKNDAGAAQTRRTWLNLFKQSAPDNGLADFLSAREHFKTDEPDLAVRETLAGVGKPLRDYAPDWIQNTAEAYLGAGYSAGEAKAIAMVGLLLPHLAQLRDLGKALTEQAKASRDAGDAAAAQKLWQAAHKLGSQLDGPGSLTLIQCLVGVAIQRNVLSALDPATTFGDSGQPVQAQLDRLTQRAAAIRATAKQFDKLLPNLSEKEIASYFDQQKRLGEEAAEQWALKEFSGR